MINYKIPGLKPSKCICDRPQVEYRKFNVSKDYLIQVEECYGEDTGMKTEQKVQLKKKQVELKLKVIDGNEAWVEIIHTVDDIETKRESVLIKAGYSVKATLNRAISTIYYEEN